MNKTYLISDLHIYHENIMKYESRPFRDMDHMIKSILINWNNTVKKDDKVFLLGDVGFHCKEKIKEFVMQLNGRKLLILGNHDRSHSVKWWTDCGFQEVSKYPIILKKFYILSHEPIYLNENMPYMNIHGHLHSQKFDSKQFVNVSVECINYTPIDFETIKIVPDETKGE